MARLGSADPVELRGSVAEVVEGFRLGSFGTAPTKFDAEDLWPLTARALATRSLDEARPMLDHADVPRDVQAQFWELLRENVGSARGVAEWWAALSEGEVGVADPEDEAFVAEALAALGEPPYDAGTWAAWTEAVKAATGRKGKGLFRPLRRLVTGRDGGPDMAALMPLLRVKPALVRVG
jgi:glutamyl-tRNA synthetase